MAISPSCPAVGGWYFSITNASPLASVQFSGIESAMLTVVATWVDSHTGAKSRVTVASIPDRLDTKNRKCCSFGSIARRIQSSAMGASVWHCPALPRAEMQPRRPGRRVSPPLGSRVKSWSAPLIPLAMTSVPVGVTARSITVPSPGSTVAQPGTAPWHPICVSAPSGLRR